MIAYILKQEDIVIIKQWKTSSTFYADSLFKADKQSNSHCSISMLLNVFSTDFISYYYCALKVMKKKTPPKYPCRLCINSAHVHP